ncbi:hypothetical protein ABZW18_33980 [Streptomyces sp. NPDC004647]
MKRLLKVPSARDAVFGERVELGPEFLGEAQNGPAPLLSENEL